MELKIIDKFRSLNVVQVILTIFFYLLFLILYLQDYIDGISFLLILLISLIVLSISMIVLRKKRATRRKIGISLSILLLLFCYELPLLGFISKTQVADVYLEPRQTVVGSGIYIVSVASIPLDNMESKQEAQEYLIRTNEDFYKITKLTNQILYKEKNKTLLSWIHLNEKSPKDKMRENLKQYFGKEEVRLTDYFKHDQAIGDSSGLSLLLTELIIKGELQNRLKIAVTGAIDGDGNVSAIGGLKEKLQTADKYDFHFMIIPSENAKEAVAIQKELKLNMEVYDVEHVDGAVELINDLNEKYRNN
ncbi:S16 family serine protease [Psychrobacillus sp. FSL K6-2843]|uniref:S16 family serine protease n=1 Tax=Psychrobacillus sp. FSL K6-2843 TaxID=2921549 RepID=UPI00315A483A